MCIRCTYLYGALETHADLNALQTKKDPGRGHLGQRDDHVLVELEPDVVLQAVLQGSRRNSCMAVSVQVGFAPRFATVLRGQHAFDGSQDDGDRVIRRPLNMLASDDRLASVIEAHFWSVHDQFPFSDQLADISYIASVILLYSSITAAGAGRRSPVQVAM